jgi:PAS domain S-box-containing protein
MTKSNRARSDANQLRQKPNRNTGGVDSSVDANSGGLEQPLAEPPRTIKVGLPPRYAGLLVFSTCLWLGYQVAYLGWDFRIGILGGVTAALHLLNFVIIIGGASALESSFGRRYWRGILLGASLSMTGSAFALGLINGTPLPLLTTLIILELVPGAVAPWQWYWSGGLAMTGIGAMLAMQTLISAQFPSRYPWNHYWLALVVAISLAFVSDVVRDIRRTKRGLERLQRAKKQLIATRAELRERLALLQANESKLLAEAVGRERAEQRAQGNESFLRAVFEASPDPIGISSMPEGKLIDLNSAYAAILGIKREEAIGKTTTEINGVVDKGDFGEYAGRLMTDGSVSNLAMDVRGLDGRQRPYLVSAVLANLNGEPCSVAVARDISGVREAGELLRTLAQASPEAMALTSYPEGCIIYCNRQYEALVGLRQDQIAGRLVSELNLWVNEEERRQYGRLLRAGNEVNNFQANLRASDGSILACLLSGTKVEINGQKCVLTVSRDITAIKQTERELLKTREELKAQVEALKASEARLHQEAREREAAEQRLRKSEAIFRKVFDSSIDIIVINSVRDGRTLAANRSLAEFVGMPREGVLGRTALDLNIWEDAARVREYVRLLKRDGSVHGFVANLRRWDGTVVPHITSAVVTEVEGEPCIVAIAHDITGLKRAETELLKTREQLKAQVEALRASEAQLHQEAREREAVEQRLRKSEAIFRIVFDTSIDIIGINSLRDGRYIAANRSLAEFAGLPLEGVLGRSALDLDQWEDRQRANEYLRLLKRDGSVHAFEANLRRWDGTVVPHIASAVVAEIEGEPCIVAIAHDIANHKRAETEVLAAREELSRQVEALRESQRRAQESETILRKIFDAAPNTTVLIRLSDGKHLAVNDASMGIYGYSREEILERSNRELNLWINDTERREYMRQLRKQGRVRNLEAQIRTKHGRPLVLQLSAERVQIEGEDCIVAMGVDITARKQIETELVAAREVAIAASEAKSNFLSSMSHEIRTPMNAMLGMADLLWETQLTAEQQRFIDAIRSNGSTLLDLINSILDLAKVESGRLSLEWIPFDLRELVEQVLETLGVRAHQKWIELAARLSPAVPAELVGDPTRLRQVLMNLIGNAIKFTEHGEVVLTIELVDEPTPANGRKTGDLKRPTRSQRLRFVVRDTGIGIPHDRLDGIFANFMQADSSTARKYGGSGLGLAIVKRLVELMGGTLAVESQVGKGSIFSFTVPLHVQSGGEASALGAAAAEKPAARVVMPNLHGQRFLVADDTAINRIILREILEERGARVAEASSGERALAMVTEALERRDPFDVVLLDSRMPGLDGIETARRLVNDDEMRFRGGAVILLVTSDALNPTLARCREIGLGQMAAFRYVVKPLRVADLAEAITQVIDAGKARRMMAMPTEPRAPEQLRLEARHNGAAGNGTSHATAPEHDGGPLKVLLAEDSPDNRMLIEAYFKATDYQLEAVENGQEAVEKFKSKRYDVVLMDIHMPVMDGYTAVRQIRQWEQANGGHTTVIALTASAQDEAVRESLAAGCDSHMAKPIRRATLLQAIAKIDRRNLPSTGAGACVNATSSANGGNTVARNVVKIDGDLSDLVPGFLAHKREDARTIAAAIECGDYATLSELGHKMKGEGGSYGLDAITLMGAAIEEAAQVKDGAAAQRLVAELATFLDTVEVVYV